MNKDEKEVIVFDRSLSKVEERINPELLKLIMLDDLRVSVNKLNAHMETEAFEGKEDPRTLLATDNREHIDLIREFPYTPWVGAYFVNDGPDAAYISINTPWREMTLRANETRTVDRTHAKERIEVIFYRCNSGENASIEVTGQY